MAARSEGGQRKKNCQDVHDGTMPRGRKEGVQRWLRGWSAASCTLALQSCSSVSAAARKASAAASSSALRLSASASSRRWSSSFFRAFCSFRAFFSAASASARARDCVKTNGKVGHQRGVDTTP